MSEKQATVFVVDDDSSVRKGLKRLLKSTGYGVEAFSSAEAFLASDSGCDGPACLVLDVQMPGLNGLNLQEKLISRDYTMPIIFITGHGDIPMSVSAMKKGAVEFLAKPFDDRDLLDAVQEALEKDLQIRTVLSERVNIQQRLTTLTPREHEILTYVIAGLLNKQIAYVLDISEKTVKVHRGRVMEKTGVDSLAELVRIAEKAGIKPAEVSI